MISESLLKLPASHSIQLKCSQELFFLSIHSILLQSPDFSLTAVYEQPSTVPGFASSLKDIPASRLVWEGWSKDVSAISCLYKCKHKPGKIYILNCLNMDPHVTIISFSDKTSSESSSINIDPTVYINEQFLASQALPIEFKCGSSGVSTAQASSTTMVLTSNKEFIDSLFLEQDNLKDKIRLMITKVLQIPLPNTNTTASSSNYSSSYTENDPSSSGIHPPSRSVYPYPSYVPPLAGEVPVGNGDLHPFPSVFIPSIPQPSFGTGSLVGPNHPIFGNDPVVQVGPQGPYLPGLPQPRFDPFYPVVPGEIDPHRAGYPGYPGPLPGRGMRGGRSGRGMRLQPPGEPNPDHLRPPQFDDSDYI